MYLYALIVEVTTSFVRVLLEPIFAVSRKGVLSLHEH